VAWIHTSSRIIATSAINDRGTPCPSRHHHRWYSGGDGARRAVCGYAVARSRFGIATAACATPRLEISDARGGTELSAAVLLNWPRFFLSPWSSWQRNRGRLRLTQGPRWTL